MTEDRLPLAELLAKAGDGDFLRSVAEAVVQSLMETDVDCQRRSKTEPPGAWVTGRKLSHAGSGYLGSALAFGTTPSFLLSRSR